MCKISVIMPSLNVGQYIEKCIKSVLEQSFRDIEIICVDAGSTDGTLEILKKCAMKDSRITIINSEIKSYGYQLNLAMKYAKGDYIGIVETDDFIDKDMYSELYRIAIKYRVDFVKGNYKEFIDNNDKILINEYKRIKLPKNYLDKKIKLEEDIDARLIDINHIWSGIYSRQFLLSNNIKFNETPGASFQDTSFSVLVGMLANSCVYADIAKYYYRIDNENSSVKSDSKINCIIDEFRYIENEMNKRGLMNNNYTAVIDRTKINAYKWNYSRLSYNSAKIFASNVRKELLSLKENLNSNTDSIYLRYSDVILGLEDDIPDYSSQALKNTLELIKIFEQKDNIILIGAGDYSNRIILLQKYIGIKNITDVYDNDSSKVGMIFNGYKIRPMSELKYGGNKYIIANKFACDELYEQVYSRLKETDGIIKYDELPQWGDMINIYLKYNINMPLE